MAGTLTGNGPSNPRATTSPAFCRRTGPDKRPIRLRFSDGRADYFGFVLAFAVLEKAESTLTLKARTRYQ